MKQIILKSVATTMLCGMLYFITFPLLAQQEAEKTIGVWLHGRNSSSFFWNGYSHNESISFPYALKSLAKLTSSYVPTYGEYTNDKYGTPKSISKYATNIMNNNSMNNHDPNKYVLVGHSMGGLVAREIERMKASVDKSIKGVITVGTPNRGAPIAAVDEARATQLITSAKLQLYPGLVYLGLGLAPAALVGLPFIEALYVHPATSKAITGFVPSPDDTAAKEMIPGSSFLKTLSNHSPTAPIVTIWGNETSPAFLRLAGSNIDLSDKRDDRVVNQINIYKDMYLVFSIWYTALSVLCWSAVWATFGVIIPLAIAATVGAAALWMGFAYLNKGMESEYNSILGASHLEQRTYAIREWVSTPSGKGPAMYASNSANGYFKETIIPYTITVSDPSDGLIGSWHAQFDKQRKSIEALECNHAEMNKHENARKALIGAFDEINRLKP